MHRIKLANYRQEACAHGNGFHYVVVQPIAHLFTIIHDIFTFLSQSKIHYFMGINFKENDKNYFWKRINVFIQIKGIKKGNFGLLIIIPRAGYDYNGVSIQSIHVIM